MGTGGSPPLWTPEISWQEAVGRKQTTTAKSIEECRGMLENASSTAGWRLPTAYCLLPTGIALSRARAFDFSCKPSVDWDGLAECIAARTPAAHYGVVFPRPYQLNTVGVLILGRASRLDAFSAYRFLA